MAVGVDCVGIIHGIIIQFNIFEKCSTGPATGQSKIDVEIKRRKYGWIGHTLQKSENEVCHSVLEWNPQGRRSRGQPKDTWRRTVLAESGKKSFGELGAQASNRHRWKLKTDGLCSTGVWL